MEKPPEERAVGRVHRSKTWLFNLKTTCVHRQTEGEGRRKHIYQDIFKFVLFLVSEWVSVTVLLVNTVSRAFAEKMWKNMKVQFVKNKEQNQSKTAVTLTVSLQMFLSRFVLLNRRCWKEIWAHLQDYKLIQAFSQVLVNPDCFSW